MKIRKTEEKDIEKVIDIYQTAREFMRKNNNINQWDHKYPAYDSLKEDMKNQVSYVLETDDGEIVGTFALIIGEDPTYAYIENGSWSKDEVYGVIHRIASSGKVKGLTNTCLDYAIEKIPYLRIDTHADNKPMQKALLSYGFKECGIIYVRDKSPRLAFDYYKES